MAVTEGLRLRGVDVLTCHEDGTSELDDGPLLQRAMELGGALFTQDADLLVEAKEWQDSGHEFRQSRVTPALERARSLSLSAAVRLLAIKTRHSP